MMELYNMVDLLVTSSLYRCTNPIVLFPGCNFPSLHREVPLTGTELTMAEVVTLLGQISTIVDLSHDLISGCCALISTVQDAPKEVEEVRREVTTFQQNIMGLQAIISSNPNEIQRLVQLNASSGTFHGAKEIITEILDLVQTRSRVGLGSKRQKLLTTFEGAERNANKTKVKELLVKLGRYRDLIQISLSTAIASPVVETRRDIGVLNQRVQAIHDGQTRIQESQTQFQESQTQFQQSQTQLQDDARRLEVLRWFGVDLEGNRKKHKDTLLQHEGNTCDWFIRDPNWSRWMRETAFIWVTGSPGTGKTVLASYLIEKANIAFSRKGVAYYYCHHSHNQDESVPFLQHIVKQLISQTNHVPDQIYESHKQNSSLDTDELLRCVAERSLRIQSGIRVIVDAVDESKPRDNLMDILFALGTESRFERVSLLVTSRPESDIEERIQSTRRMMAVQSQIVKISMCNPGVQADIKNYVRSELNKSPFGESFRREIEQCIVGGARGMFRWVACQLNMIKKKGQRFGEQEIRQALRDLPKDIFETYERILLDIPESDRDFARTALALLCSEQAEFSTAEVLVEACIYRVRNEDINKYHVGLLAEICGCLVRVSRLSKEPDSAFPDTKDARDVGRSRCHKVSLAHYTVKEYLINHKTAQGPAQFFSLSPNFLETIDLLVAFKGLQRFGFRRNVVNGNHRHVSVTRFEEECLRKTQLALNQRRSDFDKSTELYEAVLQSLKPTSQHAVYLRQQAPQVMKIMNKHFSIWEKLIYQLEIPPHGERADQVGLLLNLVSLRSLPMAEKYLRSHEEIVRLHRNDKAAIWTTHFKLKNPSPSPKDKDKEHNQSESLLLFCVRQRLLRFLTTFISHGASFRCEPEILYAAMYSPDKEDTTSSTTLKFLKAMLDLGAGANPNPVPLLPHNPLQTPEQKNKIKPRFAFTPLQVAVALNEQEWVEALLEAWADASGIGTAGGKIPHGYARGVRDLDLEWLKSVSTRTPLEICRNVVAADSDKEAADHGREIEELLLMYEANQGSVTEDGDRDTIMISDDEGQ